MKRFLSTVLLAACGTPDRPPAQPDPTAAIAPAPVEAPAERPDFPGVITSKVNKVIPAEFNGKLDKILVHQRKRVKAGEIVAKLNTDDLKVQAEQLLAQEKSSAAQAGAYAATARAAAAAAKTERRLYDRGFQSRNATISANARLAEARGQIGAAAQQAKASRVQREQIEDQIKKADVPAPIDGVIMILKAQQGEMLQRGTSIARVYDDSDLIIKFAVPKEHRNLVKEGGRVELRVTGSTQPIWARIDRITEEQPPITFFVVEADIDDSKLRPDEIQVASEGRVRIEEPPPAPTQTAQAQPQPAQAGAPR
jgi:multidrug efflux pump subunit AcrA (membrane-fusion protein)